MRRNRLPALLYHHIGDIRAGTYPTLTIAPARFKRHVTWLIRRGYRSLTLDDVLRWKTERRTPAGRRVLITFDDAYADLGATALPVLVGAGFSAVVFVPTACIGQTNRWDAALGGAHRIMTVEEIRRWSAQGIEFGAHTRSHADLTSLQYAEARAEMLGSKTDLENVVDRQVTAFAYPYGAYDDTAVQLAASIFELAFTTDSGANDDFTDPHRVRRSMVSGQDTGPDVELRSHLGFSPRERTHGWLYSMRHRSRNRA
jgi:peptidoglycan/xylan/chitin deacetylase (PgdA/CDA1 family)